MPKDLLCWSCGQSASEHPIPMSTYAECSSCNAQLHVCRMCGYWDSQIRTGCKEERAEEIRDREKANFCEWFLPQAAVPIVNEKAIKEKEARAQLQNLFSANNEEAHLSSELEKPTQKLDDLFS